METFNWRMAIDRNSEALCAIAARLIVMAGIQAGCAVATLPRHLYWRILSLLRPAEYAARRLIVMAACKLDDRSASFRPKGAGGGQRDSVILGLRGEDRRHATSEPPSKMANVATSSIIGGSAPPVRSGSAGHPRVKPEDPG